MPKTEIPKESHVKINCLQGFLEVAVGKPARRGKMGCRGYYVFENAISVADTKTKGADRGKRVLEENDPYHLIGNQLFEIWREEEFADLYSEEGKLATRP